MSVLFTRHRIRLGMNVVKPYDDSLDYLAAAAPQIPRGTDVQFECGFFFGDPASETTEPIDLTAYTSMTIEVKETVTGTTVMSKTITSSAFDNTMAWADWTDGTKQHATFIFANTETAPNLGTATEVAYYLVVSGVTSDAHEITLGTSTLTIFEDGHNISVTTPPLGDPTYPTTTQVAAMIAAARFDKILIYNQTTGMYVEMQAAGPAGKQYPVFGNETS